MANSPFKRILLCQKTNLFAGSVLRGKVNFLILLVLIPSLAFAGEYPVTPIGGDKPRVKVGSDPAVPGETTPTVKVKKISGTPGEGSADINNVKIPKLIKKGYGAVDLSLFGSVDDIIVCRSKEPITHNRQIIKCEKSFTFEANLAGLYDHQWKLIQILKTDKGYLYYLDKK